MADKGGKIRFADELFKRETQPLLDLTILQCYKNAYPNQAKSSKDSSLSSNASQLLSDTNVIQRLEELRGPLEDIFKDYAKKSFKELERIKKLAENSPVIVGGIPVEGMKKADLAPMLKAEELKGKIAQIYVEQKNVTGILGINEVSDEAFKETMNKVKKK
jgi:hypothetical protein